MLVLRIYKLDLVKKRKIKLRKKSIMVKIIKKLRKEKEIFFFFFP